MSDIGLAGIPTSALKRDPTTGEVSPAHVDGSQSIEFGRQFVKNKSTSNATQTLKEKLADSQTIRAEGEKLAYPMETGNPAYQARVSFRMFSLQPKDPAAAKKSHLAETPVDNTKKTANINAGLDETWQTPVGPTTVGSGTNELSVIDDTVGTGDIDPRFTAQSGRLFKKLSQPLIDKGKAFIDNELVKKVAKQSVALAAGGFTFKPVKNLPIVDMNFPLSFTYVDTAQYENASLGITGTVGAAAVVEGGEPDRAERHGDRGEGRAAGQGERRDPQPRRPQQQRREPDSRDGGRQQRGAGHPSTLGSASRRSVVPRLRRRGRACRLRARRPRPARLHGARSPSPARSTRRCRPSLWARCRSAAR